MTTTDDLPVACARVRARLLELALGELDPVESARDEGHLEACGACRRVRDTEIPWWEAARTAHSVDEATWRAALEGLDERLAATRIRSDTTWWVRGAVALAASVATLWLLPRLLPDAAQVVRPFEAAGRLPSISATERAAGALHEALPRLLPEVRR